MNWVLTYSLYLLGVCTKPKETIIKRIFGIVV